MVRRQFQRVSLFKRGKREKVWVAHWWEDVTYPWMRKASHRHGRGGGHRFPGA